MAIRTCLLSVLLLAACGDDVPSGPGHAAAPDASATADVSLVVDSSAPETAAADAAATDATADPQLDAFPDAASDACVGEGCDDGNPCTSDFCGQNYCFCGTGCMHAYLAAGQACGSGGTCDGAGKCVVGAPPGMVLIPAGTFWMGCNASKDSPCYSNDTPQHLVTLSAYYMDLTETTVGQYRACVDAGVCTLPGSVQPWHDATYPNMPNNPVNYVTWTQSQQFCKWRGADFELPTEAQ